MIGYIALLRGINVGKAKRIAMADLRALLGELGLIGARTVLNSGNAAFRAPAAPPSYHAEAIRIAIEQRFGLVVPVIVNSAAALDDIVAEGAAIAAVPDPTRWLVVFVADQVALASLARVTDLVAAGERFLLGKSAAYLHCGNGLLESKAALALLGKGKAAITTRNWATVLKLQQLAREVAG